MQECNSVSYDQGSEAANVFFMLVCIDVPIGTILTFSAAAPGPVPPIMLPPTTVVTYPSFSVGINTTVPANYQTEIKYCYELPPGVVPPPGFNITLQAVIVADMKKVSRVIG